jgi:hypothetical protein
MSSAQQHPNPAPPIAEQAIETVYTTVESQPDQTDWLTVVSNLRQINRQLVEQIARLEQALASSQQALEAHKEESQSHEITILQQQDELKITHERVGALFQQLETSHQIGQRQQILVETLSQKLEVAQAVIVQLETENNEFVQQSQQQAEKLNHTQQVAIELHHQLKQQQANPETPTLTSTITSDLGTIIATSGLEIPSTLISDAEIAAIVDTPLDLQSEQLNPSTPNSAIAAPEIPSSVDIIPPPTPTPDPTLPDDGLPAWTPSSSTTRREEVPKTPVAAAPAWNKTISLPKSTSKGNWREETSPSTYQPHSDPIVSSTPSATPTPPPPAEIAHKESTPADDDRSTHKHSPNWPAPTLTKSQPSPSGKTIVDVPKFPKK